MDQYTSESDSSCTRSYFVKKVEFKTSSGMDYFPEKVYTGIPKDFYCLATFYTWEQSKTEDVSYLSKTWTTDKISGTAHSPGENFMGSDRYVYKDRRGFLYTNANSKNHLSYNDFYAVDTLDGTYKVRCTYVPKDYAAYNFDLTSNSSQSNGKYVEKNTSLIGIKEMRILVKGCFFDRDNPGRYKCEDYKLPLQVNNQPVRYTGSISGSSEGPHDTFKQYDFITGHWYDWKAEIIYTDGTDGFGNNGWRDITTANEIYWKTAPWYNVIPQTWFTQMAQGDTCYNCNGKFDGSSGYDHRVPRNEWNLIHVQYFNEVKNDYNRTYKKVLYWAHQIVKVEIRGDNAFTYNGEPPSASRSLMDPSTFPVDGMKADNPNNVMNDDHIYHSYTNDNTLINVGDKFRYTAWVIFSDDPYGNYGTKNPFWNKDDPQYAHRGRKENWTRSLTWFGDDPHTILYSENKIEFTFKRRADDDYHTISVWYGDPDAGPEGMNASIAKLSYWDTFYDTLLVYVQDKCDNQYLINYSCPIPNGPNNWQTRGFQSPMFNYLPPATVYGFSSWDPENNPYKFTIEFYVTGISNGTGDK